MPVTQPLNFGSRQRVRALPFLPFPAYVNHRVVTTAETETVPDDATAAVITADASVWISDGTAVVPVGDVTDGTGSFFLPAGIPLGFDVTPSQTLSVISASGTANVSFAYYVGAAL